MVISSFRGPCPQLAHSVTSATPLPHPTLPRAPRPYLHPAAISVVRRNVRMHCCNLLCRRYSRSRNCALPPAHAYSVHARPSPHPRPQSCPVLAHYAPSPCRPPLQSHSTHHAPQHFLHYFSRAALWGYPRGVYSPARCDSLEPHAHLSLPPHCSHLIASSPPPPYFRPPCRSR